MHGGRRRLRAAISRRRRARAEWARASLCSLLHNGRAVFSEQLIARVRLVACGCQAREEGEIRVRGGVAQRRGRQATCSTPGIRGKGGPRLSIRGDTYAKTPLRSVAVLLGGSESSGRCYAAAGRPHRRWWRWRALFESPSGVCVGWTNATCVCTVSVFFWLPHC